MAKQGYSAYQASQHPSNSDVSKTGGPEYNSDNNSYNSGSGHQFQVDHDEVVRTAEQHGHSGDSSLYRNAMEHVNGNQHQHNKGINEDEVQAAHHEAYNQGGASNLSAEAMGGAAALQALKSFTSGGGGGGGGGSNSQLISLAMGEASKLFDKSGGAASGNKQDVVSGAAMTVVKLLVQSKASSIMGGGNSGGMGSLMGLASKFM